MVVFNYVIFGQHGKQRILRPVHIVASNDRGWTLCRRNPLGKAEPVTHARFGRRMAQALADNFTCLHCAKHAERMKLVQNIHASQPQLRYRENADRARLKIA